MKKKISTKVKVKIADLSSIYGLVKNPKVQSNFQKFRDEERRKEKKDIERMLRYFRKRKRTNDLNFMWAKGANIKKSSKQIMKEIDKGEDN